MLSEILISSLCLLALSLRASSCPVSRSDSVLCFCASRCHSGSHLDHSSALSAHLCNQQEVNTLYTQVSSSRHAISLLPTVHTVGYLALRSDECSKATLPLMLSPCSIRILWFSFLNSKISCWACVRASHGLAAPGFIQEPAAGCVPCTLTPLFAPAGWTHEAKWDGGTRSSWTCPASHQMDWSRLTS